MQLSIYVVRTSRGLNNIGAELLKQYTLAELREALDWRALEHKINSKTLSEIDKIELKKEVWRNRGFEEDAFDPINDDFVLDEHIADDSLDNFEDIPTKDIFEAVRVRQKALYGDDDRKEIIAITDLEQIKNSRSIAVVVSVNDVFPEDDEYFSLSTILFKDSYERRFPGQTLCSQEPFRHQPSPGEGTAFLIAPHLIATAAHVIGKEQLHAFRFVFDFDVDENGESPKKLPVSKIYAPISVKQWELTESGADWAIFELDREVEDREPLKLRGDGRVSDQTELYVVGHPSGLPKKIAGNAQVRNNDHADYFVANLDTYGGNSGSPVFNAETHEVEGILVRGETDFASKGDCYASLVCPISGCRGEECTRIHYVTDTFNLMV